MIEIVVFRGIVFAMSDQPPFAASTQWALIRALREYTELSERVVDLTGAAHGLHRTDMRTLSLLMRRQAQGLVTTPSDLSRILGLSSASTTALVDRMERQGHAERTRSEKDRRSVTISHTDSAAEEGRALFMPIAGHTMRHLAQFSDEELAIAVRVLEAATAAMADAERELGQQGRPSP